MIARIAAVSVCILLALVCGYFFLAGFEYPGVTAWKIFTGGLSVFFLVLAFIFAVQKARS
jgi:hypothetical protein